MNKKLLVVAMMLWGAGSQAWAETDMLQQAREVAMQLPPALKHVLQQEMKANGPVAAIGVCQDQAPKIAERIADDTGWQVKRVSLKARNASLAVPDAWERDALLELEQRLAAGEKGKTLEKGEQVGNEFRYVKALMVKPVCLHCHGSEIKPPVKAALKKHYPDDMATGYSEGQIRGAISIRKAL